MIARNAAPDQALINPEAERTLLGRILGDETVWWNVCDALSAEDFGMREHADTYRGMIGLSKSGKPISIPTLISQIKSANASYSEGSIGTRLASFLAEGSRSELHKVDTGHLISVVKHRSICRSLIDAAGKIKERAETVSTETPIEEVLSESVKLISSHEPSDDREAQKLGDLVGQVVLEAEKSRRSGRPRGLQTGLRSLDEIIGPVLPSHLIVIAGETGSGKTALATQVAFNLAAQGVPSEIFSLEMDGAELATRIISKQVHLAAEQIANGTVSEEDTARMMAAGEKLVDMPIWIDSRPKPTVGTLMARLSRAIARNGIRAAVIDHLQYVRADYPGAEERVRVAQVVDDIKAMQKRLQIPIFLLSHVSRQVDFTMINTAANIPRPVLSQLYGSSAIEKAADQVVFVHRPAWFLERATPSFKYIDQYNNDVLRWRDRAELVLPKRRSGQGYMIRECIFSGEETWFSDLPNLASRPL